MIRAGGPVALAACLALAGCGGDGDQVERSDFLPGSSRAGGGGLSQAPVATCEQWQRASPRQRDAALASLEQFFGRASRETGEAGPTLPWDDAYDVLARTCAEDYASNFNLYKIYTRALAFGVGGEQ